VKEKIRIGISSCLLGEKVRYDGGHKLDHYLRDILGQHVQWVPVCPEVEFGLPVPREAMRLMGNPSSPRLITRKTGIDHTNGMRRWAKRKLSELERADLCGFIFKSRSPSSGMKSVKVYSESGMPSRTGTGIFAGVFMSSLPLVPVEDDGRLHDFRLRENFIERIFVFMRWKELQRDNPSIKKLIAFHEEHKLLIMSHSSAHLAKLGRLVARAKEYRPASLQNAYLELLMEALKIQATVKKNVNVLQHIMGYFKNQISKDEKQEILEGIGQYHKEFVPLVVPITLLKHYVRKYDEPYLKKQLYLNPHPFELMLRNHV
jgi:uncharacterized protein YbgA (DUF1722 family)/uncharacterized protein YbbK (DUF523 family)